MTMDEVRRRLGLAEQALAEAGVRQAAASTGARGMPSLERAVLELYEAVRALAVEVERLGERREAAAEPLVAASLGGGDTGRVVGVHDPEEMSGAGETAAALAMAQPTDATAESGGEAPSTAEPGGR